ARPVNPPRRSSWVGDYPAPRAGSRPARLLRLTNGSPLPRFALMPLSMMELRERFIQHPLLPNAVLEQQNRWRQRWGMQPKSLEPGEDWRFYFDPTKLHDGSP